MIINSLKNTWEQMKTHPITAEEKKTCHWVRWNEQRKI